MMTAGACVDRPEKLRWTHSVWENADGELRRIVHSVALLGGTDYTSGRKNNDFNGPWRWRNVSYPRAWVGYAAHKSFNPFVLIHRTNVPLMQELVRRYSTSIFAGRPPARTTWMKTAISISR